MEPEEMRGKNLHDLEVRDYHMRCLDAAENHPERDGNPPILLRALIKISRIVSFFNPLAYQFF
jgi:hypothetical protein